MARKATKFVIVATPIMERDDSGVWHASLQDADCELPHLGVYLLAGILRSKGREVDIFDWVAKQHMQLVDVASLLSTYDVAFFSCNSMNWAAARALMIEFKRLNPATTTVVGGPHATHFPESFAAHWFVDFFFQGEADTAIEKIYRLLSGSFDGEIPGLLRGPDARKIEPRTHAQFGDIVWKPAFDDVPIDTFKTIPVETSRGCKFACEFCSIPSKNNWRGFEIDESIRNIEYSELFSCNMKTDVISVIDDTFTTNHRRILDLFSRLNNKFHKRLSFDATLVDLLNVDIIHAFSPFLRHLLVGAEVSQKSDAKRIRKAATPEIIIRAARNLADAGVAERAVFSFIIGFPWQTREDCLWTVKFAKDLILQFGLNVYLQWYWPMPGSWIWETLLAQGRVTLEMVDEPGFYRAHSWFYRARQVTEAEVSEIDEAINLTRYIFEMSSIGKTKLSYASPLGYVRKVNRNPLIIEGVG